VAKELTTGLLISDDCVAWSTVQGSKGGGQETDQGDFPLPKSGDTEDDVDRDEIVAEVLQEHSGRFKGRISLAIPTDQVLLKVLELPGVDDEDLPGMVEIQADKLSPFPIENMVVSHEVLQRTDESTRVLVAAVQVSTVEAIGSKLRDLGLTVRRVDVEVMGWWSALQDSEALETTGSQVIILLSGQTPTIVLASDGVPQIIRSIKTCAGLEGEALAEALGHELNFTLMSRELMGDAQAIPPISVFTAEDSTTAFEEALREASGATLKVVGLDTLSSCAQGVAHRATRSQGGSAEARGLLDLAPPSWRNEQQSALFKKKMIRAAVGIVGLWLLIVGGFMGFLYLENHRLAELKAEHAAVNEPARQVRLLRRRARMIEAYVDHSESALECLREISMLQPDGIELTSYSYRKDDAVKITALGKAVGLVYDFQSRLVASEFFPNPILKGPRTTKKGEAFDVTFSLGEDDS
jgi:Tfp pilus assembly PilM family ATPase